MIEILVSFANFLNVIRIIGELTRCNSGRIDHGNDAIDRYF